MDRFQTGCSSPESEINGQPVISDFDDDLFLDTTLVITDP